MPSPEAERVSAYQNTVSRLEPEITPIDASAYYASAAISLKRIADSMERTEEILRDIRAWGIPYQGGK